MQLRGKLIGFRPYAYRPSGADREYNGYCCVIARADDYRRQDAVGDDVDCVTISLANLGDYRPAVGDCVAYHLYRDGERTRCGYVLPVGG